MTAIKKTTIKSTKSLAPATKSDPATKPVAKTNVAIASAPVAAVPSPAAKVKPVASKPVVTAITARVDVGFGNTLYVRGQGPGLSWDQGIQMTCVGDDAWYIPLGESARGFTLKFLINDVTWSVGPDFTVSSGQNVTFSPAF